MRQNRRQAVANARRTASNRVNSRKAGMRNATGQPVPFKRPAGEFRNAGHTSSGLSTQKKTAFAVNKLMTFI
jgi:hypothetical protein